MTAICETCHYYRRVRPPSQLLAAALDVADGPVANALAKIVEDEQKWLEAEATVKRSHATTGDESWPARPLMSAYCALREAEGRWLIPEIRNRGGQCATHQPAAAAGARCADCAYRRAGRGFERDRQREQLYADMLAGDTMAQTKTSSSDESLLTRHREGAAALQALELSGAYAAKGVLLSEPRYLDWCAHDFTGDEYVACALRNPYGRCPDWTGEQTREASTHAPAADRGEACLPAEAADDILDMMVWLLEIQLPPDVRDRARAEVVRLWSAEDRTRQFVLTVCLPLYQQCAGMPEGLADLTREQAQPGLVAALRTSPNWLARRIVDEYDRVNAPLAPGSPPLTQEIADAFVDVLTFMESIVSGADPAPPTDQVRGSWIATMAAAWPGLPPQVRQWLTEMPVGWAQLRYQWQTLRPDQRYAYQEQLRVQLGIVHGVAGDVVNAAGQATAAGTGSWYGPAYGPGPRAYGPGPQAYGPPVAAYPQLPAWARDDAGPAPTSEQLLDRITSRQQAQEAEAEHQDARLALQVRMHNQMERSALISNMMNMEHESIMSIIKNIK
ncbi:hypothetical protein [Actinoplanes sp. NPDC049599]|uniref:hypothetical protein n=1 Tax=Actinoplanes sp. NPDC049599 TaxID=3363903 RepID=UPI0037BC0D7D